MTLGGPSILETSYADHFLRLDPRESLLHAYSDQTLWAAGEAREVVQHRSLPELHKLAQFLEAEIKSFAESLAEESAYGDLVRKRMGASVSRVEIGVQARGDQGDLKLLLGAIHWGKLADPPLSVTRAELLATFALWKVQVQADGASKATELITELSEPPLRGEDSPDVARVRRPELAQRITALTRLMADLTGEIVRAAALAREEVDLTELISSAHDHLEADLRRYQEDRLKQAGSLGGIRRAEKYAPVRRRAQHLYLDASKTYRSRSKAAEQITERLRQEGMEVEISTVLRYLKELDDERTSAAKIKKVRTVASHSEEDGA
jgi:hypothetical protein